MNTLLSAPSRRLLASAFVSLALAAPSLPAADGPPVVAKPNASAPVTVTDNGTNWIMDNGLVKITIVKNDSTILTLVYHGVTVVGRSENWERVPSGQVTPSLTIDPAKNGGQRAEVAVKGVDGRMDIEVRYAMERGASGFYTYAEYTHKAGYPAASFGENRFILMSMNPTFDWLSVDSDRNMLMCSNDDTRSAAVIHAKEQSILSTGIYKNSVEHKYTYCGIIYRLAAFGWSSTKDHIGVYFINPSTEYIGGGAEKMDLVCHMHATILDYWTSGHYAGGAGCNINAGEEWSKVVGPIFVYCNALADPEVPSQADLATLAATAGDPTVPAAWADNATALWQDALRQAKLEKAAWPYDWVNGVDYPHKDGRGTVTGQLVLNDPQAASTVLTNLTVGLAHPDYGGGGRGGAGRGPAIPAGTNAAPGGRGGFGRGGGGGGGMVDWTHDAKFYEFWNDGGKDGKFTIPNVRPGTYTMHAFADGVLGEYTNFNITVTAGKTLDLGKLEWKPVRYGKQIWEIGYPDRTGGKFFKGDGSNYWLWGWGLRYPLLFPNDITYTIGKSDYHKDWFFQQTPHSESRDWINPAAKDPANQRFGWIKAESITQYPHTDTTGPWRIYGRGRATTWTIKFNMEGTPKGRAALRVALGGADGGGLAVAVNSKSAGTLQPRATNALRYNTDKSVWQELTLFFDAALLKPGENVLTLTVPAGELTSGVVYDYLRLELDENAQPGGAM